MKQLKNFLYLIGVFIFSFGIAFIAILSPGPVTFYELFIKIFYLAYWPIHGEITVLEKIYNETCFDNGNKESECLDFVSFNASFFLLIIYMVIASVLLLNLLIAIFRYIKVLFN